MNLEALGVSRKRYFNEKFHSGIYYLWSDYVQNYKNSAIADICCNEFSKTAAIHSLYQKLLNQQDVSGAKNLLRAFLTDQGLLFPQTRERWYTEEPHRSMKQHLVSGAYFRREYDRRGISDLSESARILLFAEASYRKRQQSFEEKYPLISLERVVYGIQMLIDGREGPFQLEESNKSYSLAECRGDLAEVDYQRAPREAEYIMMKWINTLCFSWDGGLESLSSNTMQQILNFTIVELYEFFSAMVPQILSEERIQNDLKERTTDYCPSIDAAQIPEFQKQVAQYQQEDLALWKAALPVLERYLHPDFTRFTGVCISSEITGTLENLQNKLAQAFLTYCNAMEPVSAKGSNAVQTNKRDEMLRIAAWFLTATPGDSDLDYLLFAESPHLIFHFFRSPVHRYIYNYENRAWHFKRVVEDAYIRNPLPITNQSLEADERLFLTIVDVCAELCKERNIAFPKDEWIALWICITQCVRCLQFQAADLVSASQGFIHILYLHDKGSPVVDKWIEQKLTSDGPNYVLIWRAFMNKWCNLSRKQTNEWNQSIEIFRRLFESAASSSDDIRDHLSTLCNQINWTGIPFLPPHEELANIDERIRPRARNGEAAAIRSGRSALQKTVDKAYAIQDKKRAEKDFKCLWMEWTLIQCVCDQARRELMESIWYFIKNRE